VPPVCFISFSKCSSIGGKTKTKGKFLKLIKDRAFSLGLILVVGFLLLVSLVLSTALSAISSWVSGSGFVSEALTAVFLVLDVVVSVGVVNLLFASIFNFFQTLKFAGAMCGWAHF